MQYLKVKREDVQSLPTATKTSKRPALWSISGRSGEFVFAGQLCLYDNLCESYRRIVDRDGGLATQDDTVVARVNNRVYCFAPREMPAVH